MNSQPLTSSAGYQVLVTDRLTPGLVPGDGRRYESPLQTEHQARALTAILIGAAGAKQPGPWRQAIAGGQRTIELRAGT